MHLATRSVDGVRSLRITGVALDGEHQREVAAGAAASDTDLIRVDPVGGGVSPHKTHRPLYVGHDFVDMEARLRAMHHDEGRVAGLRPAAITDAIVIRVPTPAHDFNHRRAIRLGWCEDVQRERKAIAFLVDDVAGAGGLLGTSEGKGEQEGKEATHGGVGWLYDEYPPAAIEAKPCP